MLWDQMEVHVQSLQHPDCHYSSIWECLHWIIENDHFEKWEEHLTYWPKHIALKWCVSPSRSQIFLSRLLRCKFSTLSTSEIDVSCLIRTFRDEISIFLYCRHLEVTFYKMFLSIARKNLFFCHLSGGSRYWNCLELKRAIGVPTYRQVCFVESCETKRAIKLTAGQLQSHWSLLQAWYTTNYVLKLSDSVLLDYQVDEEYEVLL